jgi:hypothetical protein
MSTNGHQKKLQMIYKVITYVLIVLGGTISGALMGSVTGPIDLRLSVDNMGTMGACIGAILAVTGCRFAMEHHEAVERNRDLFRALEGRLSRVGIDSERATLHTPPNPRSG